MHRPVDHAAVLRPYDGCSGGEPDQMVNLYILKHSLE